MLQDWAFAQKGQGITVQTAQGEVTVLEFNEFLGRIASGQVSPNDLITSRVMTDGEWRRVGDLKLYTQVISGQVQTENLPRREPDGVLIPTHKAGEALPTDLETPQSTLITHPPVALMSLGTVVAWLLALAGFSLLCSLRPGTPGVRPAPHVQYRPASHPLHPPFLPRT